MKPQVIRCWSDLPCLLTIEEAGQLIGMSRPAAYNAAKRGEILTRKIGRRLMVPRGWLAQFCGEPQTPAKEQSEALAPAA